MRNIRSSTLTLPISALVGCLFGSSAAIAQSAFPVPVLEKMDVCPEAESCGTGRLKGVDATFDVHNNPGNFFGFSWQCEGLKYPAMPWPEDCHVSLEGPAVDKIFGVVAKLDFDGPRKVSVNGTPFVLKLTSASISPMGCLSGGKCVATFSGTENEVFDTKDKNGNTFGYSGRCEGLEYPSKPWPADCVIRPRPVRPPDIRLPLVLMKQSCSPECVVERWR